MDPLPESDGYDCILVVTDWLKNYMLIEPTTTRARAPEFASLFYRTWYRRFGLPIAIMSDRDKLFVSKFWQELFKNLNVHLHMSTTFHPETDGSSEHSNKTVIEALHYCHGLRGSGLARLRARHLVTQIFQFKLVLLGVPPPSSDP